MNSESSTLTFFPYRKAKQHEKPVRIQYERIIAEITELFSQCTYVMTR